MQGELALCQKNMRAERYRRLGHRMHDAERILFPVSILFWVLPPTPELNDILALDVDADRGTHFFVTVEVGDEGIKHRFKALVAIAVDGSFACCEGDLY